MASALSGHLGLWPLFFVLLSLLFLPTGIFATVLPSPYKPHETSCPLSPLVRVAQSISESESNYVRAHGSVADAALIAWLKQTKALFNTDRLPGVALTTSGGGYRALLTGAGVVQALDSHDSNVGTAGLYQALRYHAGLSGGSWMLASLAAND